MGDLSTARDLSRARRSPALSESALLRALPPASRHILRGGPHVMAAAGAAMGLSISQTACRASVAATVAHANARVALWLGPDEQLLLAPQAQDGEVARLLEPALRGLPHSLVDVSHRQTALEIRGPHAILALSAGCPLDLEASVFPVGMCTRTVLAKAEVVLWRTTPDAFHIEVWRSFAAYVSRFLAEVARELVL